MGWLTDLAVLRLGGAQIVDLGDHLIVRSPDNPGYHWGNFVFVTDPAARDDAQRWVTTFERSFPGARHLGIGLSAQPDPAPWAAVGLTVEADDVLSTVQLPQRRSAPAGYTVELIGGPQRWAAAERAELAENAATGQFPSAQYADFLRQRGRARRRLADTGAAAYFGAFDEGRCAAQLGIVLCAPDSEGRVVARFQDVLTDAGHRRRGLAGHLVRRAADWAGTAGARRWVIVTEPESAAGRLYGSLGFTADTHSWRAVLPEPREARSVVDPAP
jgi:GNAT superfamily N-acetyltransferase